MMILVIALGLETVGEIEVDVKDPDLPLEITAVQNNREIGFWTE
jgi:hypothetical protein